MSSSIPVRGDPLLDWPQPFDENLVDEEEQRVDSVEVYGESAGGSGTRTDAHPLPQLVCTLRTRSRKIRCASQTSKTR